MTAKELLERIEQRGLRVDLVGDLPYLRGPLSEATEPLLKLLKEYYREEIIALVKERNGEVDD